MTRSRAPLRVAVVNDYEIVVAGVARMLSADPRVDVIELDNRRGVGTSVDIVLADMFAAVHGDGIDVEDLVAESGALVVVYTWRNERTAVARALAQGASGYLSKGLSVSELVDALERIHRGETVISPPTGLGPPPSGGDWPGRHHGLSEREAEVLALIAKGQSNPEIAETMELSVNTVKTYVRSAYTKIGVTSRSRAVRWALRHGFAPESGRIILPPQAGPASSRPAPEGDS